MSKNKIALIDLDPILHIVANIQYYKGNKGNEQAVILHIKTFIDSVIKSCNATHYLMFFQGDEHKNYRREILQEYKSHRTTSEGIAIWKPVILNTFRELKAIELKEIESDDALRLWATKLKTDYIIVENDKDLHCIPGLHYNPFKKNLTTEERFYFIDEEKANLEFWKQVLTGDASDMPNSLCGIELVGPTKALNALKNVPKEVYDLKTVKLYIDKYGFKEGLERLLLTYKLIYLLEHPVESIPESLLVLTHTPLKVVDQVAGLFDNKESIFNIFE